MRPPSVSFEIFPPKSDEGAERLLETCEALSRLGPDFLSVTYGACGSTRDRTLGVVHALARRGGVPVAGHITCAGASRADIDAVLTGYRDAGVARIVALRGDGAGGAGSAYAPHPDGYAYASDLIAGARRIADFDISVGCYPETHPEARGLHAELDILKRKAEAGATRALTQFFFEPAMFLRYRDAAADAGVSIDIIPGVMLQPNIEGLARMARLCGAYVPPALLRRYDGLANDAAARDKVTVDIATELCASLRREGVNAFHFYTMNRASLVEAVCRALGVNNKQRAA